MIFKDENAAIKGAAGLFKTDISPAHLLSKMFEDESRYKFNHFLSRAESSPSHNKVAFAYFNVREKLVKRLLAMGCHFKQRIRTVHLGIELIDRFFLDSCSQNHKDVVSMSEHVLSIFSTTCFLIASKYDEIDDHLVFINDVKTYFASSRAMNVIGSVSMGSWKDIVECERMLLYFFNWDIGFVLPIHFLEMFLANGVLFKNECCQNTETS